MRWQTVALFGALSLSVGWAIGARFPVGERTAPAGAIAPSTPRPLGVAPSVNLAPASNQARLPQSRSGAPRTSRNPFAFGRSSRAAAAPAASAPAAESAADSVPEEASRETAGPSLRLAGMAQSETPNGPELTAMVHDGQTLQYVRVGDALPGGYTVVDVQETTVTIRDSSGGERTLRLP